MIGNETAVAYVSVISQNLHGETPKKQENAVRIAGNPYWILTGYLQIRSSGRHCHSNVCDLYNTQGY
jgi:hypothetical protein